MTEENKQLLLKVLCAMLPYGIMIYVEHDWFEDEVPPYNALLTVGCHSILNNFSENPLTCYLIIKPYLRPMSSMTEEEKKEYDGLRQKYYKDAKCAATDLIDWLNQHHFDYRGLIEKGLALPAPPDMYKIN